MASADGIGDVARPPGEDAWFRARVAELEAERDRLRRRTHEIQERADRRYSEVYRELARRRWSWDFARRWLGFFRKPEGSRPVPRDVVSLFADVLRDRSEAKTALGMARRRVAELEAERDDLLVPDEPDPATLARAAGLEGGFDETAPDPALAGWADADWEADP